MLVYVYMSTRKENTLKKINVTLSLPVDTHQKLQSLIGRRKMSAFVAQVIDKELDRQVKELKQAYIEAEADAERQKVIRDWSALDGDDW